MRTRHNSMNQQMPLVQNNQNFRQSKFQPKSPPIIEIYDLEALEIDSQFSSLSSYSSSNEFNKIGNSQDHNSQLNSLCSSSSASSSPRSSIESSSFHIDNPFDKPFTFQEFISSIINCNDKKWHKLIIQDLARLLELKFRDFRKEFTNFNQQTKPLACNNTNNTNYINRNNQQQLSQYQPQTDQPQIKYLNSSVYLDTESDIFTYIAEKIFELAFDEPNGILGTVINLRLISDNGKVYHICNGIPYDQSTIATSEITITLKEDVTGLKKFLKAFKWYSSVGKYFALHIDSQNFDISKKRLY